MEMNISFFVEGLPRPAGSKRAFAIKKGGVFTGRVAVADDNPKSKDWKCDVRNQARLAYPGAPVDGPLKLLLVFTLPRPKNHFRSGKNANALRESAPMFPATRPDTTKLIRAVEDALTGILWKDDAQITAQVALKRYGTPIGVRIELSPDNKETLL